MPAPIAQKETAVIVSGGEVRLSADLIISPQFKIFPVPEKTVIELWPCKKGGRKVYYTNPRAKSGRISLGDDIRMLGFEPKEMKGQIFQAKVEGDIVKIYFEVNHNGKHRTSANGSKRARSKDS